MEGHPQYTYGPLTDSTELGKYCLKKKELQAVAATVGWPLLQALREAITKQMQVEKRVKTLEEVKL